MDKRMTTIIALCMGIGLVGGIFTGYGIAASNEPETPAAPRIYTLTILNFRTGSAEIEWAPTNPGTNFTTTTLVEIVMISFEENTNVTLKALGGDFGPFSGPDSADVHAIKPYISWILMNNDKIIEVMWV
jgi:hypothetical protein